MQHSGQALMRLLEELSKHRKNVKRQSDEYLTVATTVNVDIQIQIRNACI